MMDVNVSCFLALLQAGLWKKSIDVALFHSQEVFWDELFRLSKEQAVVSIVFDGIRMLPDDCRPPKKIILEWYAFVRGTELSNYRMDKALDSLFSLYANWGIQPVLLKGRCLASLYPFPMHRQCGDIDLFLGNDYDKAKALLLKAGVRIGNEGEKHLAYIFQGVEVENHRWVAFFYHPIYNRRFQIWVRQYLPNEIESMALGVKKIQCPPSQFNAVYLLVHLLLHFISDGVALRQIMDWAVVLRECASEIDAERLLHELHFLQIEDAYKVFGYIAVRYLGLPSEYVHANIEEVAVMGNAFFADILEGGNWGQKRSQSYRGNAKGWKKVWCNFRRVKERCEGMSDFCPNLVRSYPYYRALNFVVKKLKGLD